MKLKDFWERQHQARSKDEPLSPTDFAQEIQEIIGKSPKRILDIGCAAGRDSLYFATQGHVVTGVDISSTAVSIANNMAENCGLSVNSRFIMADISKTALLSRAFDVVYARMSLQYFNDSEMFHIIGQLLKSLTTEGSLFAQFRSVLDSKYGVGEAIDEGTFLDQQGHIRRFFNKATILRLFKDFKMQYLSFDTSRYETVEGSKSTKLLTLIGKLV